MGAGGASDHSEGSEHKEASEWSKLIEIQQDDAQQELSSEVAVIEKAQFTF